MSVLQTTLKAQKAALRKAITEKLAAVPLQVVQEQTLAVTGLLSSLPAFKCAKSLSCYLSMPSGEVDTTSLVLEILKSGRGCAQAYAYVTCDGLTQGGTLFVPKIINKSGEMDFLEVYGNDDLTSLPSGVWGIKEPDFHWQGTLRRKALETPDLDLILFPAVAFDRSFARLGHGKGFYDRFVTTYHTSLQRRPILVGLALREQVLPGREIPMGEHDWPMDYIVTPDEVLTNPKAPLHDASQKLSSSSNSPGDPI